MASCYFTLAEPHLYRHCPQKAEALTLMLERNLKASLLLHDAVTIRATAALRSDRISRILLSCPELLRTGVVRPEIRRADAPLCDQLRTMRFGSAQRKDRIPIARALDE